MDHLLENLWDDILSNEPERIRCAFIRLSNQEQNKVAAHLDWMVNGKGWHPAQKKSAETALKHIQDLIDHDIYQQDM